MQEHNRPSQALRFGLFEVDLRAGELRQEGRKLKLHGQPVQILEVLLEHPGEVVTREELRQRIWPGDTFIDFDHSLNTAINKLREALGDSADDPHFVETIPRRGYRFVAVVERVVPPAAAAAQATGHPWQPRLLAALGLLAVLAVTAYVARDRFWAPANLASGRIMLAVLPFENLSGDPDQEYFSDGLTEEMITQVAQLNPERLGVIARTSTMQYKGIKKRADEIGRELAVDYILEGSVRREAARVRISAQLIRVSDQTHLWAESYERDVRDILILQRDIAGTVAEEITVKLSPREQTRLGALRPVNPEAQELYLRGRFHLRKLSRAGAEMAIKYLEEAIALEPNYALAYANLADAYVALSTLHLAPLEAMPKAKAAALKSLELDDNLAEAHARLGVIKLFYDWDWPGAEHEFRLALKLDPNLPEAHLGYADYLTTRGRHREALQQVKAAQALDPLSPFVRGEAVWLYYFARRYDEAIEECQKVIELEPNFAGAYTVMGLTYARQGRTHEAIAAGKKAQALTDSPVMLAQIGVIFAESGKKEEARKALDDLVRLAERRYVCGYNVATVYVALGETDQAFQWFERAYRERSD